jgi:GNAT superfamily N-acetyltransferase
VRFAIRPAKLADADGIARVHAASWRDSYRSQLPAHALLQLDTDARRDGWRRTLADPAVLTVVAYDVSSGDIVGFCDAGRNRGQTRHAAELYRIYLDYHAKRHGLGREMFEYVTDWLRAQRLASLIIWVLDTNTHACHFYEAMGGAPGPRVPSRISGFPIVERAYTWDAL